MILKIMIYREVWSGGGRQEELPSAGGGAFTGQFGWGGKICRK